jgi:hypothetical protein
MSDVEYSMAALTGGQSQKIAVSAVSAQTTEIGSSSYVVVTPDVNMFFRRGPNPTAVSDGTDQILLASLPMRLYGLRAGDKLAFITASGSGTVYITPGA